MRGAPQAGVHLSASGFDQWTGAPCVVSWSCPAPAAFDELDGVHVWKIDAGAPRDVPEPRAERGHGILARYAGVRPEQLRIVRDGFGKPALADDSAGIHFNVSGSAGLTVLAVARSPVGVDVEFVDETFEYRTLVERYFTSNELRLLAAAPPELTRVVYFTIWTRKEAILKRAGVGIAGGIGVESVDPRTDDAQSVVSFEPRPGWTASLAVSRSARHQMRFFAVEAPRGTQLA